MKLLREYIRGLLQESVSPEKLKDLASKIMVSPSNDFSGQVGEKIALMWHPNGMNLNSIKNNNFFPFADIAAGPLPSATGERTYRQRQNASHPFPPLYSVKASSSITFRKGVWQGADPFANSRIKGSTIYELVNERGQNGLRDEIDAIYGPAEAGKVVKLRLGAIGIFPRAMAKDESEEPRDAFADPRAIGVTVKKYGPKEFEFVASAAGLYENPVTRVGKLGSESLVSGAFGAPDNLTSEDMQQPASVIPAQTSGRKDQKSDSARVADQETLDSLRSSIAAIDDSRISLSNQDLKTLADISTLEPDEFEEIRELVRGILSRRSGEEA
ncbi:MAG: hypothetical protein CMB77_03790 [Euryarchaeota archaeon]|nr:hypothetical protein [Euryarchaeota archaeon]|tara:strand:- start:41575 stop:42558 length:984 start_codon:yes stop_codon:yes gene_type:complete